MSRTLSVMLVLIALLASDGFVNSAAACPLCGEANESAAGSGDVAEGETNVRPKAYMYSILFMLSMPMMIFGGFGVAFYRMTRSDRAIPAAEETAERDGEASSLGDAPPHA